MSHNASRSNSHGFCDAIFSTSPIRFGKENKTPIKEAPKVSRNTSDEVRTTIKNQMKSYKSPCSKHKLLLKNDTVQQTETIKRILNADNAHSKSTHVLQKHESFVSTNLTKPAMKTGSLPKLSDDKTGTLHSCTSKLVKSNVLPINKTPIKKYLSDHNLSQVTPDCFNKVQLETSSTPIPNKSHDVVDEGTIYDGESSNLTVGVRVRPLNLKELSEPKISSVVKIDGQNVTVECEMIQHTFMYDHCFVSYGDTSIPGHASQETVFNTMVLPLVQNAFEGYNVCLFAYGQTGSGKSYSMMGLETQLEESCTTADKEAGIIPRFCEEIFMCINKNENVTTNVEISYFEIYNEKIHDLLASTNSGEKKAALKVREHPVFGPYIVDLSQHSIKNYKDLQIWLKVGNSQRVTAATGMNEKSSRSHSIFSIILTQNQSHDQLNCTSIDSSRRSKINLVDLAGSERLSQTCASGNRLREGVSINKSLLTLGKVIASLAENTNNRKRGFVPYRESVLTWLLKIVTGDFHTI